MFQNINFVDRVETRLLDADLLVDTVAGKKSKFQIRVSF